MKKALSGFGVYVFLMPWMVFASPMAEAATFVCYAEGWKNLTPPMAPISRTYIARGPKERDAQMQALNLCQRDFNDRCMLQSCFKERR